MAVAHFTFMIWSRFHSRSTQAMESTAEGGAEGRAPAAHPTMYGSECRSHFTDEQTGF